MLLVILAVLVVVVLGNSATATKLQNARNIALSGAVTGNVNFDGSQGVIINTTQSNIAILEGTVTTSEKLENETLHYNTYSFNFPEGFNKNNCYCIAFGISTTGESIQGYSYEILDPSDIRSWLRSSLYRNIILGMNNNISKIGVTIGTPFTEQMTIRYKIVLMKI